ncbi:hypothetical protein SASPL_105465 [Salvia splendens]|uniref:Large subunit ribosomal protein L35Ae n=1 Tax=Salvia splendens TaxID=180675 RepID=A0A8X9A8P9_SALSN|nr:hypothetical protein SASPL_105465 [Salvia splendens]
MVKGRQGERVRLYVRGTILGYKRSKSNQYPNTSLVQVEGMNTQEEVAWYLGKKLAYIYKAKVKKNGSHYRCIWGKVARPHGNSGVVRAKFKSNLPPKSMIAFLFVMAVLDLPIAVCYMNSVNFVNRHSRSDEEIGVGDPDTVDDEADGGPIRGDVDVAEFADEDGVVGEKGVEEGGGVRLAELIAHIETREKETHCPFTVKIPSFIDASR